jgi:hypothetical protein
MSVFGVNVKNKAEETENEYILGWDCWYPTNVLRISITGSERVKGKNFRYYIPTI